MVRDYAWVTSEMFEEALGEVVEGVDLMTVPGIYDIVREHFNNDVLHLLDYKNPPSERCYDQASGLSRDEMIKLLSSIHPDDYDEESDEALLDAVLDALDEEVLDETLLPPKEG